MKVVLEGVVGSTAYGLNTKKSDVDTAGVYVATTEDVLGFLPKPKESIVKTNPDVTYHEVDKFMRLCAKCNPTVTELLWLDEYNLLTVEGKTLVAAREAFLSERMVRDAYMGYATSQARKLVKRQNDGLEGYGPKTKKRSPKHQRHLMRLCLQCEELLTTGQLTLRVKDPAEIFAFGEATADEAVKWFEDTQKRIDAIESCLPESPDVELLDDVILGIRRMNSSIGLPIHRRRFF